jgi:DNA-binding response OmpR family regulator
MAETLLVVDDEPELLSVLQRALEQHDYVVDTALAGAEAIAKAMARPPDLIILDLMLPQMSGLEVCRALRADERLQAVPVIFLTARHETAFKVAGLDLGADDYLTKPFEFHELLARVRARLRNRRGGGDTLQLGDLHLVRARHELQRGDRAVSLTRREFDLLALFLQHPGQLLLRRAMASQVWGYSSDAESNVLDVYIRRLRAKLEQVGYAGRIRTVRGDGYVLEPPAPAL